jgi:hypothetical protein
MRNNEDRTHVADGHSPAPHVESKPSSEGTLNFVTPTDFVELPSKGKFYSKEHPLHDAEHLEIRQMTAKDEDILTSRALLEQGIAIDRLLENLVVDKNISIDDLLVGDRNAIMITARMSAYGSLYETKVQCPVCNNSSDHEFDLKEILNQNVGETSEETLEKLTESKTYLVTLPRSEAQVEVKFLTGKDEKKLIQVSEQRKKHKIVDTPLTDQLKACISSINGVTNFIQISDFVDNMPARDSKHLRTAYFELMPNINLTQDIVCKKCYSETKMEVPFTADFFWPR